MEIIKIRMETNETENKENHIFEINKMKKISENYLIYDSNYIILWKR